MSGDIGFDHDDLDPLRAGLQEFGSGFAMHRDSGGRLHCWDGHGASGHADPYLGEWWNDALDDLRRDRARRTITPPPPAASHAAALWIGAVAVLLVLAALALLRDLVTR